MLPAIKVWKMDYSFIVKNYLNLHYGRKHGRCLSIRILSSLSN